MIIKNIHDDLNVFKLLCGVYGRTTVFRSFRQVASCGGATPQKLISLWFGCIYLIIFERVRKSYESRICEPVYKG